jgi:D-alanyl-D-alanine carboxypeptidase/D-alanyl-D-alanine-endopeptidase (penicillin-binding protein 4)
VRAALAAMCATLAGCASAPPVQPDPIPAPVREVMKVQQLSDEAMAFVAFALDAPGERLAWQAERAMPPASTMKSLTGIVALDRLGANWRGRTELLAEGPVQNGVLEGALVLRGGADATLDWNALHGLLRQAREAGVRELRAGVRIDRSRFNPAREDIGAAPFDEAPEFPYNTRPDALNLNGNELTLHLDGAADGAADGGAGGVQARWAPAWPGLSVDASALRPVERPCADWDAGWQPPSVKADAAGVRVRLAGEFPRGCKVAQNLNLIDRQQLAAQAIRQQWQELGGQLAGEIVEGRAAAEARVIAVHQAPPLAEWLRGAMKRSDNPLTRLLYLELGAAHPQAGGFASTRAAADAALRAWLREHGIDDRALVTDNGSGLSRSERLSPALLAGALQVAAGKPWAPELQSALPLAGRDGTLARRLKNTPAEARARLKTGTLRDAVGLAGYLLDGRNRRWVVVALVHAERAAERGRPVLDALIAHLAAQR